MPCRLFRWCDVWRRRAKAGFAVLPRLRPAKVGAATRERDGTYLLQVVVGNPVVVKYFVHCTEIEY